MKILIVTARYYPETFSITNIAETFVKMGHDVTVLTGRPHYGKSKIYGGYEKKYYEVVNGVKIFRVKEHIRKKGKVSLMLNYLSIFCLYKRALKHKFKKFDFDVVLSHVLSPIFTMRGLGKFCKSRKIPLIHYGLDLWPESMAATSSLKKDGFLFIILKKYCIRLYKQCNCICFSSPSAEVYFKDYLNIKLPFYHIYQPCLTAKPSENLIFNHTYLIDGKLHILYCGTIAKFHRLDLFICALSKCQFKENIIFDVVGSGSEFENIKNLVSTLNLKKQVIFHGRVNSQDTIKYYLAADLLYVPLIYNCSTSLLIPQKLIEYFMYGKPILGMIKGDGAELLKKASNLNIISAQNISSLSDSIDIIATTYNKSLLKQCGMDNRNFYDTKKEFSLSYVANQLISIMMKYTNISEDKL